MKITRTITFEDDKEVIEECYTTKIMFGCKNCPETEGYCKWLRDLARQRLSERKEI